MSFYSKWARKEHRLGARIAATSLLGFAIAVLVPFLVIVGVGPNLDRRLGLPGFDLGALNWILGGLLGAAGLSLGVWSVYVQLSHGRGTPLPIMPTQELLTRAPFSYCRNPMTLGAILAYLSFGIGARTIAGIGLALCFAGLLLFYLKRFEEKELAERFGEAYLQYKREVPFIIPRRPKRR